MTIKTTMSLRFRLNLLITLIFLAIMMVGTWLIIHNARKALAEETESTAQLTLQLLELAFNQANPENQLTHLSGLMRQIKRFANARHMQIEILHGHNLEPFPIPKSENKTNTPQWFVKLVEPTSITLRQSILVPGMPSSQLVIRPDPVSEIDEAWVDARSLFNLLIVAFLIAMIWLYLIIGRSLKPINAIIKGLDNIEQGDYQSRLQPVQILELDKISQKFNHMAEVLEQSRDRNRALSQQNLAIQEEERRHLARELHDEMGQSISAIKAVASSIGQRSSDQKIKNDTNTIAEISGRIYSVVSGMMRRLHPAILDEFGLIAALNDLVDNWNSYHENTFCHFQADKNLGNLSSELSITAYRLVQECLNNVAKHANAEDVYIEVSKDIPQQLQLSFKDNGQGFDINQQSRGLGLAGIRQRVEALNGHYTISSKIGSGVQIEIILPLEEESTSGQ